MEPIDYGGALARGWRLLAVLGVLGLLAGLVASRGASTASVQWKTTSQVGAVPSTASAAAGPFAGGLTTSQILFVASSESVMRLAAKQAGLTEPTTSVRASIALSASASGPAASAAASSSGPPPGVVTVTVRQGSAAQSAALNNAFDLVLEETLVAASQQAEQTAVNQVQTAISNVQARVKSLSATNPTLAGALESQVATLAAKEAALISTPTDPGFVVLQSANAAQATKSGGSSLTSSRPVRALGGLVVGLIVAALVILAIEALDKRLRSSRRTERSFGYPVVAEIPDSSSPSAEAYRMLRLSLLHEPFPEPDAATSSDPVVAADDGDLWAEALANGGASRSAGSVAPAVRREQRRRQIVLVVSPGEEPTRPFVAANLAAACAEAGQRVAVISTVDVGSVASAVPSHTGEVRPADVEARLEGSSVERVYRLSLGHFLANPGQVVTRAPAVLDALRSLVDVVIVEVPPFLTVHHGEGLAHDADVVLTVAETNVTTTDEAARMGRLLRRLDAPVLGVVLTNVHVKAAAPARGEPDDEPDDELDGPHAEQPEVGVAAGPFAGLPSFEPPADG